MNKNELSRLLEEYKKDNISKKDIINNIVKTPYEDLGYAKIDHHREIRNGYPEVIYCEGKSTEHIVGIVNHMMENNEKNILGTRANKEVYLALKELIDDVEYNELARTIVINREKLKVTESKILIITGGTADIPVAEEAAVTAEILGNSVERLYDVGVAGLHRLLSNIDIIMEANVIITVAGMEGALTSVVGGLVDKPVIGVPTSVGYGASYNGLAALLSMLNSCASGVSVVNIDNGFGAAYTASMINQMGR